VASVGVVNAKGGFAIAMVNGTEIVCTGLLLSLTAAVNVEAPLLFGAGVPEIVPVDARVSPEGSPPDARRHL
jgi:hypothetical protein